MTNKTSTKPTARRNKTKALIVGVKGPSHGLLSTRTTQSFLTLSSPAASQLGPSGTSLDSDAERKEEKQVDSRTVHPSPVTSTSTASPLGPPTLNPALESEAARQGRVSPHEFANVMHKYQTDLDPQKVEKALFTRQMRDDVYSTLQDAKDTKIQTAQFRHWARKTFLILQTDDGDEIIHQRKGKPCAIKEDIYRIIALCHERSGHLGRDGTNAEVGKFYSYIPKSLIAEYCMRCPTCIPKDSNKAKLWKLRNTESGSTAGLGPCAVFPLPERKNKKQPEGHMVGSRPSQRESIDYSSSEPQHSNGSSRPLSPSDADFGLRTLAKAAGASKVTPSGRALDLAFVPQLDEPQADMPTIRRLSSATESIPAVTQQCEIVGWEPPCDSDVFPSMPDLNIVSEAAAVYADASGHEAATILNTPNQAASPAFEHLEFDQLIMALSSSPHGCQQDLSESEQSFPNPSDTHPSLDFSDLEQMLLPPATDCNGILEQLRLLIAEREQQEVMFADLPAFTGFESSEQPVSGNESTHQQYNPPSSGQFSFGSSPHSATSILQHAHEATPCVRAMQLNFSLGQNDQGGSKMEYEHHELALFAAQSGLSMGH